MYQSAQDEKRAAQMKAYMRNPFPFLGIASPRCQALSKQLFQDLGTLPYRKRTYLSRWVSQEHIWLQRTVLLDRLKHKQQLDWDQVQGDVKKTGK
ncbi:MAG: DNA alkylation repair protein [Bacteroidota bacterium]